MIGRLTTVRALSAHIKELFAFDDALASVWIEGEVSGTRAYSSGHVYFSLVEDGVKLECVLFRREAAHQRFLPKDGVRFALHGRVDSYEGRSSYQLIVDLVQPAGAGIQALELEALRQKLQNEGLFDLSRKRPLPEYPLAIGVVTSADGAVWHDIQNVLKRRFPLVELILSPSLVQGPGAPASLIAALEALQSDGRSEVIILARGGGSADDLAAFNDEALARAVFASSIPVISAVGHESDWSITDDVADHRAPTPSAAAEMASPSVDDLVEAIRQRAYRISRAMDSALRTAQQRLDGEEARLRRWSPELQRQARHEQIEALRRRLATALILPLADRKHDVASAWASVERHSEIDMRVRRVAVERNLLLVEALDARAVIRRGFAVLTKAGAPSLIGATADVAAGDRVEAHVSDGIIDLTVTSSRTHGGNHR